MRGLRRSLVTLFGIAAISVGLVAVMSAGGSSGSSTASVSWRGLAPRELERRRADLAAGYQRAIVRALVERIRASGADRVAVVGGVAANSELRRSLPGAALAPLPLCTDNAAMIASAARYTRPVPYPEYLSLDARASA